MKISFFFFFPEMIEAVKPKTTRKTPVWKVRKDFVPIANVTSLKPDFRSNDTLNIRTTKETKTNTRVTKNTNAKSNEKPTAKRTSNAQRNAKDDKSKIPQPTIIQAVIQENVGQLDKLGDSKIINIQTSAGDKTRTIVRTTEAKSAVKTAPKAARPSIIKKAIIKEGIASSSTANSITVSYFLKC